MRLLRRRAAKRPDAAPRKRSLLQRLAAGEVSVTAVVRLVAPPTPRPDAIPSLTRDAIRERRRTSKAASEPPKPQEKPRRKLRDLIGGGSSDTGKPSKSESQKQAERDAEYRRRHGRPPRVLIRTADGPTVTYHDPDAPAPDPNITYWSGADGSYEEWKS